MKYKRIIAASVLYFILQNSFFFWTKLPGLWEILITAVLVIGFLFLSVVLLIQISFLVKERFKNRNRATSSIILSAVLLLAFFFPLGVIDHTDFEGPTLAFAQYEGVANCTVTLKLKEANRFKLISVCFGTEDYEGNYQIKNDTITLQYDNKTPSSAATEYGVISLDSASGKYKGVIMYYNGKNSQSALPMAISQYDL